MLGTRGGMEGTHKGGHWLLHHPTCCGGTQQAPVAKKGFLAWPAEGGHLPVTCRVASPGLTPQVLSCRSQTTPQLPAPHRPSLASPPVGGLTCHLCARRSKPLRWVCPTSLCSPSPAWCSRVCTSQNESPQGPPRLHLPVLDCERAARRHGLLWLPGSRTWGPPSDSTVFAAWSPVNCARSCPTPPPRPEMPRLIVQGLV